MCMNVSVFGLKMTFNKTIQFAAFHTKDFCVISLECRGVQKVTIAQVLSNSRNQSIYWIPHVNHAFADKVSLSIFILNLLRFVCKILSRAF